MGGCVSVKKDPIAAMKVRESFGVVISSPIKEKPIINVDRPIAQLAPKSQSQPNTTFPNLGSKEENFFDSHPWLESDCEEDFYSVNGEFTPSRGNTPLHPRLSVGSSTGNKTPGHKPELPPRRKKLFQLFEESSIADQEVAQQHMPDHQQDAANEKSDNGTTLVSERITNGADTTEKKKRFKFVHCCLPILFPSRRFHERSKTTPAQSME